MLIVAQVLAGVPWGSELLSTVPDPEYLSSAERRLTDNVVFQTLTTSYAAEVAPVPLRAFLTTWVNACWGIGQLLALGVLRALLTRNDDWGWRIPYALQVSRSFSCTWERQW